MNELTVGLLTSLPVLFGAMLGFRRGGGRTLAWLGKILIAWGSGIGLATHGWQHGWHWPLGLVTPLVMGILATLLVTSLVRRLLNWRYLADSTPPTRLSFLQRSSGTALGAAIGFVVAIAGWQVALLFDGLTAQQPLIADAGVRQADHKNESPNTPKPSALSSLAMVAHQGFLKHLPVAGPISDDMLAVGAILKTPQDVRRQFALHKEWDTLATLPSLQAIANNEALFADIDSAAAGNLAALYRLQKHPLILVFFQEKQLQAIMSDLQTRQLADELREFQNRDYQPAQTRQVDGTGSALRRL